MGLTKEEKEMTRNVSKTINLLIKTALKKEEMAQVNLNIMNIKLQLMELKL